jgi:hypothetical protein
VQYKETGMLKALDFSLVQEEVDSDRSNYHVKLFHLYPPLQSTLLKIIWATLIGVLMIPSVLS